MNPRALIIWITLTILPVALLGCYGDSSAFNPTVAIAVTGDDTPPDIASGARLTLTSTATSAVANNTITRYRWTQLPGNAGVFAQADSAVTTWQASHSASALDVTLTLLVETQLGGKAVKAVTLRVLPDGGDHAFLKPMVTWDIDAMNAADPSHINLPNISANTVLRIKGAATTEDPTIDPIISYEWSQAGMGVGSFSAPNTFTTSWAAPTVLAASPVTLTLAVRTKLGGLTEQHLALIVLPLNISNRDPLVVWDIEGMNYADENKIAVVNLPRIASGKVLRVKGSASVVDALTNPITEYQWTQSPAVGAFLSTSTFLTSWAAPTVPAASPPLSVTLTLTTRTLLGGQAVKELQMVVLPAGPTP